MKQKEFDETTIFQIDQDKREEEIAPGVVIERRRLLWIPAMIAATVITNDSKNVIAQEGKSNQSVSKTETENRFDLVKTQELGWEEFLKQSAPKAQELHVDSSVRGQEVYLKWMAFMASRLRLNDIPNAKVGRFKTLEPPLYFGVSYRGTPFFCVEWRMSPGAFLPPHNHPNVSVCTVGIEGEARIRNFEIVDKAPEFSSTQSFRVRETHNEIIAPGRINTLSPSRDNIHTFQAGKSGARGIDITTYHGPDIGFSFLDLQDKSKETEAKIFEAVWKKLA